MKKTNKLFFTLGTLALSVSFLFSAGLPNVHASNINNQYQLNRNEGSASRTNNNIIVAHETGSEATAQNNASFEKNTWNSNGAYVQYIVGNNNAGQAGNIYQIGQPDYQSWGAGSWANANSPVQIELARTYNKQDFKTNYHTYINLLRESAQKYGIPLDTDSNSYVGVKSHNWISNHVWGDHTDPYGYLSQMGVTPTQFAHDVKDGVGSVNIPTSPSTSQPQSQPTQQPKTTNSGFHSENATFTNGNQPINVHYGPSTNATKSGTLPAYASVHYYGYVVKNGYVWTVYTGFNGKTLYLPVRQVGQVAWGTFR
ncbi:N-acetylmuramoyl-L-alanine amidase [Fructilactobacillus fructivorans]|uniref:N-acetylmuramidase n=1 Tax=Fructilactobacillus fructivorans TaxID=1614 RepID=A0AAE6P1C9_9LACO|nr:N-acetylmuramoyl-L-alanine amidase [Fructilactobacillus fructivorans]KRN40069.1 N-acetylmuramidase [Fructilactobacillus fructivorans]QFX92525.1 N-acetylmuramidase [Fructilactobacillus fructivorans]RDV65880.1 N-acetylmuramidase [Fructilactobacillus fructivorans]